MQQASMLFVTALRRGVSNFKSADHQAWIHAAGMATVAAPEWANNLPAAWKAAATPGSSYRRKMHIHFNVCDYDKDGIVRWNDLQKIVQNYGRIRNLAPGSTELRKIQEDHEFVFRNLWSPSKDLQGQSTEEQMVRNMITAAASGMWKTKEEFVNTTPVRICFDVIDADGDDFISSKEFSDFWDAHQLKPEERKQVFSELDTDGDGRITRQEYYDSFYNWIMTPHADPGHKITMNMWGLVPSK